MSWLEDFKKGYKSGEQIREAAFDWGFARGRRLRELVARVQFWNRPKSYALGVHTGTGVIVCGALLNGHFILPDLTAMRLLKPEQYAKTDNARVFEYIFDRIRKRKMEVLVIPTAAVKGLVEQLHAAQNPAHQKFLTKAKP